jgi:hypothetical protein
LFGEKVAVQFANSSSLFCDSEGGFIGTLRNDNPSRFVPCITTGKQPKGKKETEDEAEIRAVDGSGSDHPDSVCNAWHG